MNSPIFFAILGVAVALPQKKVIDPVKDIKFDHHDEEHHIEAEKEHHDDVAHEVDHHEVDLHKVDHHNDLDHHDHHAIDHHAIDHHLAQYEHKLLHRAHALAEHEHALAQHEHALTHLLAPRPPYPLDKHTTYVLVPLPHAVIPVKPGALYDSHVKKHALFVPAVQHH